MISERRGRSEASVVLAVALAAVTAADLLLGLRELSESAGDPELLNLLATVPGLIGIVGLLIGRDRTRLGFIGAAVGGALVSLYMFKDIALGSFALPTAVFWVLFIMVIAAVVVAWRESDLEDGAIVAMLAGGGFGGALLTGAALFLLFFILIALGGATFTTAE